MRHTDDPGHLSQEDGLPLPRRYWAILTTALGIGMAVMDGAIVNIALPSIAADLGVSPAQSVWVVNAYLLAVAISLLSLASLGDILGYRIIYRLGLLVFTFSSLGCALADSLPTLIAARFFQGLGAAGIMSVNVALVRFIYPRRALGKGIGINAMIVAVSTGLGPTVAAGILAVGSWPWLFAINIPIGCAAMIIAARSLPKTPRASHRFDYPSAVMNALGIGLLVVAVNSLAHDVDDLIILAELLIAGGVIFMLIRRQLVLDSPLLPVDLLRIKPFALAIGTSFFAFTGHMVAFISLPFYLYDVLGYSAVETGLLMTPWPLAVVMMAPVSGALADRHSSGLLCTTGMGLMAMGLLLLARMPNAPDVLSILWRMAVCGLGFGLFHAPNNRTIISSAPRERSGAAAGMQGTARLLGQTSGAALTALIFGLAANSTSTALLIASGFAFAAALVSTFRIKGGVTPLT
ncbi:MAG: MFS transporter [Marinobacter sp.]|nr:MFS transporter [Marinobacter sp.]